MDDSDVILWVMDHISLFPPIGRQPVGDEAEKLFRVADILDKKQKHKATSCGRCYTNAQRAIMRELPMLFRPYKDRGF